MIITTYSDENFIIDKCIGSGGMSKVFAAKRESDDSVVAVKMLSDSKKGQAFLEAKRELEEEIRILEILGQKGARGVPKLLGMGENFYVMEYVKGKAFGRNELNAKECIEFGISLCDILSGLHEGNPSVLYLDLKPSNIMRRDSGEVCLVDYGTARVVAGYWDKDVAGSGFGSGTMGYAAPEQYGGLVSESIQTDIYLLGRTLDAVLKRDGKDRFLIDELRKVSARCSAVRKGSRYSDCREGRLALFKCQKNAIKREILFAAGVSAGFLLFILSACFILMYFADKISPLYGIISVLSGRLIWNSERMAAEFRTFIGKNSEGNRIPEKPGLFLDIVKTCDIIEM